MVRTLGNGPTLTSFSRDQLFVHVYEACRHRPHAAIEAGALVDTIIGRLLAKAHEGVVDAETITGNVIAVLNRFDTTAATIYAAYHQRQT